MRNNEGVSVGQGLGSQFPGAQGAVLSTPVNWCGYPIECVRVFNGQSVLMSCSHWDRYYWLAETGQPMYLNSNDDFVPRDQFIPPEVMSAQPPHQLFVHAPATVPLVPMSHAGAMMSPVPMSPVPMSPVPMSPVPMSPVPMSPVPMSHAGTMMSPVPMSPVPMSPVPMSHAGTMMSPPPSMRSFNPSESPRPEDENPFCFTVEGKVPSSSKPEYPSASTAAATSPQQDFCEAKTRTPVETAPSPYDYENPFCFTVEGKAPSSAKPEYPSASTAATTSSKQGSGGAKASTRVAGGGHASPPALRRQYSGSFDVKRVFDRLDQIPQLKDKIHVIPVLKQEFHKYKHFYSCELGNPIKDEMTVASVLKALIVRGGELFSQKSRQNCSAVEACPARGITALPAHYRIEAHNTAHMEIDGLSSKTLRDFLEQTNIEDLVRGKDDPSVKHKFLEDLKRQLVETELKGGIPNQKELDRAKNQYTTHASRGANIIDALNRGKAGVVVEGDGGKKYQLDLNEGSDASNILISLFVGMLNNPHVYRCNQSSNGLINEFNAFLAKESVFAVSSPPGRACEERWKKNVENNVGEKLSPINSL